MRYTIPDSGNTQSPIGVQSNLESEATLDSQPIATPTTSGAEQTPGPNRRNQVIAIVVVVASVGLGLLVGGLAWFVHRRRFKIDAKRMSKTYTTLDGEEGRFGMLEASIVRARYTGPERSVSPPGGQTPVISPMEQEASVEGDIRESRSQTRMETPRVTITVPQSTKQREKNRCLLQSLSFPKTALPPYPGSPPSRQ